MFKIGDTLKAVMNQKRVDIGDRKDGACLQMHGLVSRQPKRCRSAMLDPKGRSFCNVSGSL